MDYIILAYEITDNNIFFLKYPVDYFKHSSANI